MANWLNRKVQGAVESVGNMAGGAVGSVGNGVNSVGQGIGDAITNTTRYWGQGVAGYGNDIKDSVGAQSARVSTAGNPLGLSGTGQGKGSLPSVSKPVPSAPKALPASKPVPSAPKALPASKPAGKAPVTRAPAAKPTPYKAPVPARTGGAPAAKKPGAPAARTAGKPVAGGVRK